MTTPGHSRIMREGERGGKHGVTQCQEESARGKGHRPKNRVTGKECITRVGDGRVREVARVLGGRGAMCWKEWDHRVKGCHRKDETL